MTWRLWEEAWQSALYGPDGFYRRSAPAEHFATSAQGLGTTGPLLAEALLVLAERHGLTRVVEIAAGRGELLRALARASDRHRAEDPPGQRPGRGAHRPRIGLTGVDVVDPPDHLPPDTSWLRSPGGAGLPDGLHGLTDTLLVAHEWLDVVPCPVATREDDGTWRHVLVADDGTERTGAPVEGAALDWLAVHVPDHVGRAEVGLPRDTAYADLVSRVDTGLVLVIDYGHLRDTRPRSGTLTGYRDGAQVTPRPDGSCDLTAHVAVDSLGAREVRTQRQALHDLLGRDDLPPHELSRADPAAYLHRLSRANALATLTASTGLGAFWWATTPRGTGDLG